ncbi:hypothetical protein SNE40_018707 [Patella caerulea]|uniref:Uncharacterized protein n=1 Tax=Patella caerulea TaxID=87958 RepID=A0AAN8PH06_PATCE
MELPELQWSDTACAPATDRVFRFSDAINDDREFFKEKTFHTVHEADDSRHEKYSPKMATTFVPKVRLTLNDFGLEFKGRFNESLNTYVDTRKRIRRFHSLNNLNKTFCCELPSLGEGGSVRCQEPRTPLLLTGRSALKTRDSNREVELPNIDRQFLQSSKSSLSYPFRLHKSIDTRPKLFEKMPQRFSIKPMNIWKHKTDILLQNSSKGHGFTPRKLKLNS